MEWTFTFLKKFWNYFETGSSTFGGAGLKASIETVASCAQAQKALDNHKNLRNFETCFKKWNSLLNNASDANLKNNQDRVAWEKDQLRRGENQDRLGEINDNSFCTAFAIRWSRQEPLPLSSIFWAWINSSQFGDYKLIKNTSFINDIK